MYHKVEDRKIVGAERILREVAKRWDGAEEARNHPRGRKEPRVARNRAIVAGQCAAEHDDRIGATRKEDPPHEEDGEA